MKHRADADRSLLLLVFGAIFILGVCNTPAARGEQRPVSQRDAASPEVAIDLRSGQQTANAPAPAIAATKAATAVALDTSFLREIEASMLPAPILKGPNRYGTLPDYYWAENHRLRKRLEHAKKTFHRVPMPTFRALTLVAGAAGVGKTFIKREVFNKDCPPTATCKFDILELYDEWAKHGIAVNKPDLSSDDLVVNFRKSVSDKGKPHLREYLEAEDARFYVIDSLDEIHPDDYAWVLEQVEDFVFHHDRQFVHVAVFGRGFTFRDFWQQRTEHRDETDVELFLLNPPKFRTTGDLLVSSWNYHSWKYDLAWAPDGNETAKMPLDAYSQWVESGFARNDKFQSITFDANDDIRCVDGS